MPVIAYIKAATNDNPWDGGDNVKNLKNNQPQDYYERMFAWRDPNANPETKGAYKFPHHETDDSGNISAANIKACNLIIGMLNGVGGAGIPDGDVKGVYNHVCMHLKDANITPVKLNRSKPLKGNAEMRSFSMPDLFADDSGNIIQGHAAVFGQPYNYCGMWMETISRGAFDKTDFTDVLFDVNHNLQAIPLARSRNNNANSTLQLQIDEQGLNTRATLDVENNADAKALYSSIKRGDINGMSYIFSVATDEWTGLDTEMPCRNITAIAKVYEVSAVSMPANPGTDINARSNDALESAKRILDSARAIGLDSSAEQRKQELTLLKLKTQTLMKG
jgi:HK97 family phage prohead protease